MSKSPFLGDLKVDFKFGPLMAGGNNDKMMSISLPSDDEKKRPPRFCPQTSSHKPLRMVFGMDKTNKETPFVRCGIATELPGGEDGKKMIAKFSEIERHVATRVFEVIQSNPKEFKKWKNTGSVDELMEHHLSHMVTFPEPPHNPMFKPKVKYYQFPKSESEKGIATVLHRLLDNGKWCKDPNLSHENLTRNSKVVMSVTIWGVWFVKEQFGIHMDVDELFISPGKNERVIGHTICMENEEPFQEATEEEVHMYMDVKKRSRDEYEFEDNVDHKRAKDTDDGDY